MVEIPGFVKIESKRDRVVPRIILFEGIDLEVSGRERVFDHNYIVITFKHDSRFVLDLTGYQFGFQRVLYTMVEYQRIVLKRKESGIVVDVRREMRQDENNAMGLDDNGQKAKIDKSVREASLERLQLASRL